MFMLKICQYKYFFPGRSTPASSGGYRHPFSRISNIFAVNKLWMTVKNIAFCDMFLSDIKVKILINHGILLVDF